MYFNPLLSDPQEVARNIALRLVREFLDGWYLVREQPIPFYELFVDLLRLNHSNGRWAAYVQPVGNSQTEIRVLWIPSSREYVMLGSNIATPIIVPEEYVR